MNSHEELGKPDLCIGGFELWISGYAFPDDDDWWERDFINVTARFKTSFSIVQVSGPFLRLPDVHKLRVECKQIYDNLSGEANLNGYGIHLTIKMTKRGQCEVFVSINPDELYEEHFFMFKLDQSYLLPFLTSLETILRAYPIK